MNVIGHDHITTYSNVDGFLSALGKKNECNVDLIFCQELLSFMRAEGNEVKGTCCKNPI